MEKPSRLFVPLVAATAFISADNAKAIPADEVGPLSSREAAPSPDPAAFCEELRTTASNDSDIQEFVDDADSLNCLSMKIEKEIHTVLEDGQEVILSCLYPTRTCHFDPRGRISVKDFSKNLFTPNGDATILTVQTPTATYTDYMTGLPHNVQFNAPSAKEIYDASGNYSWKGTLCIDNGYYDPPCDSSNPTTSIGDCDNYPTDAVVCEALGIGLGDFDAAVQAGRRALRTIE